MSKARSFGVPLTTVPVRILPAQLRSRLMLHNRQPVGGANIYFSYQQFEDNLNNCEQLMPGEKMDWNNDPSEDEIWAWSPTAGAILTVGIGDKS